MARTYSLPTTHPAVSARSHGLGCKAAHPRHASDGEPEERRVDERRGVKLCAAQARQIRTSHRDGRRGQERHTYGVLSRQQDVSCSGEAGPGRRPGFGAC